MNSKWKVVELGKVLTLERRKTNISPDGTYKLVTLPLHGRGARLRREVLGSQLGSAKFEVRAGDLMVSKIDARKGSISLLPESLDGSVVTGDSLSYSVDTRLAMLGYIDLVARTPRFASLCESVSGGTTNRVRLDPNRFLKLTIALPPLTEQKRIVDLIGSVDDAIEAAEEKTDRTSAAFESTLNKLVGRVPSGSPVLLADKFRVIDCEHKTAPATEGEPFAHSIGTGAIRQGRLVFSESKPVSEATYREWTVRAEPSVGDVIMTREAPVGQIAMVRHDSGRVCLGQRTVLIRPTADISGDFLWAVLMSRGYQDYFVHRSIGQTVARVNVRTIKDLPLPLLSDNQIESVSDLAYAFSSEIDSGANHVASLRALRSELLTALLSGDHAIPESYDALMDHKDGQRRSALTV